MKKRIRLTEGQLFGLIREALEDNQDWRSDMLNANRRRRQAGRPYNMAQDEFRTPQARERYKQLADKRFQQAHDLTASAQDKFNRNVVPKFPPEYGLTSWEFKTGNGRDKGEFYTRRNINIQNSVPEDYWVYGDDLADFRAINDFRREKSYYDETIDDWVDVNSPNYDENKAKEFWKNHYKYLRQDIGESLVRRVTENVIRKLNESLPIERFEKMRPEDELPEDILEMVKGLNYDEVMKLANDKWEEAADYEREIKEFNEYYRGTYERPDVGACAECEYYVEEMNRLRDDATYLWEYATYVLAKKEKPKF